MTFSLRFIPVSLSPCLSAFITTTITAINTTATNTTASCSLKERQSIPSAPLSLESSLSSFAFAIMVTASCSLPAASPLREHPLYDYVGQLWNIREAVAIEQDMVALTNYLTTINRLLAELRVALYNPVQCDDLSRMLLSTVSTLGYQIVEACSIKASANEAAGLNAGKLSATVSRSTLRERAMSVVERDPEEAASIASSSISPFPLPSALSSSTPPCSISAMHMPTPLQEKDSHAESSPLLFTHQQQQQQQQAASQILKEWLNAHLANPYPTESEKAALSLRTGLSGVQINTWFVNARRRYI